MTVYVENLSKAQESLLLLLEMQDRKLLVDGTHRREFLCSFVPLLAGDKKAYKLQGPCQLAKLLCGMANFCDCDNSQVFVEWKTIEKELIKLRKELYPEE